jgi:translocation and assembly module TamA
MRWRVRVEGRVPVGPALVLAAALACLCAPVGPAAAFDFFGLFGNRDPVPAANAESLPYTLEIEAGSSELRQVLQDASALHRLRGDAPPSGEGLVGRARADVPRLVDAMWGAAYYNAVVTVEIAGVALSQGTGDSPAAVAAAERYRGRDRVPVRITVVPGPRFVMREVRVVDPSTGVDLPPDLLPPRVVGLAPGSPAKSADVLAAQARIIDHFRRQSRPLARAEDPRAVVDHTAGVMDVTLLISPGPIAGIGEVTVSGTQGVDPRVVQSYVYARPGEPYSPEAIASMRRSVQQIEALASVRVREADALDAAGNLPITLDVTERPLRSAGISARYSTLDGPAARAYFTHRNLFGGAERLRLEADVFYLTDRGAPRSDESDPLGSTDLGGRVRASFLMPALGGTRTDLIIEGLAERDRTEGYTSNLVNGQAALRHRFGERFSVRAGVEVETGRASDILGSLDYTLVGFPVALDYDSTDNLLDPTRGIRATAALAYYPDALGTVGFLSTRLTASGYLPLDAEGRTILAGRVGFGSIVGAELQGIPASRRFYAGGGSSVRGFAYRSLSPEYLGVPIGGRSLIEGSVEARLRVTDEIGVVPFVDAGMAFRDSFPTLDERMRVAVGLGLRYHTGFGPIRIDVAVPVNRAPGDDRFGLYIGIGQAF